MKWPFNQLGGLTEPPFSSYDPEVCAHQIAMLERMLKEHHTQPPETSIMILNRLETAYLCVGWHDQAEAAHALARVHGDRLLRGRPDYDSPTPLFIQALKQDAKDLLSELRFRKGLRLVNRALADLGHRKPWEASSAPAEASA